MRKVVGAAIAATALSFAVATPAFAAAPGSVQGTVTEYRGVFPTEGQCWEQGRAALRADSNLIGFTCRAHWTGQRELWVEFPDYDGSLGH
jgi:hypothetical protein